MSASGPWIPESIPGTDSVFYRVPIGWLRKDQRPHTGVFKKNGDSMSTDWEKYSTAADTQARPTNPSRFAVLRLPVDCVRKIQGLTVIHDPVYEPDRTPPNINRAHCSIHGLDASTEIGYEQRVKLALLECCGDNWEIPPGSLVSS
jgi:hypothetical protein